MLSGRLLDKCNSQIVDCFLLGYCYTWVMEDLQSNHMTKHINADDNKLQSDVSEDDFVCINVGGMIFETMRSTLERYPSTLLGNQERRDRYFIKSKNAYFFDRNRQCFEAILNYYQSYGLLILPINIPMNIFEKEVSFFDLGEDAIFHLKVKEGHIHEDPQKVLLPKHPWQRKIWVLFEFPDSSWGATITACWSVLSHYAFDCYVLPGNYAYVRTY